MVNRELVDERDDLPANTVIPLLRFVLACRLEVVGDGTAGDGDGPTLRLLFKPANELSQPAIVSLGRRTFSTQMNL